MTEETPQALRARALVVYKAPFKCRHGYIYDAEGNMVMDDHCDESPAAIARLRGWGHLCRKPNPEALQDELGDLIAEALSEFWERHKPSS